MCCPPSGAETGGSDTEPRQVEEVKASWLYIWSLTFTSAFTEQQSVEMGGGIYPRLETKLMS